MEKRQKTRKNGKNAAKTAKTKLSITRSIFKLEAPDFAWYSIYTKRKNVKTSNSSTSTSVRNMYLTK